MRTRRVTPAWDLNVHGKRWPKIEHHVRAAAARGLDVAVLHKPLTDSAWRVGDPQFGEAVFDPLRDANVRLIPMEGVHAKTIIIDDSTCYEGSLNLGESGR